MVILIRKLVFSLYLIFVANISFATQTVEENAALPAEMQGDVVEIDNSPDSETIYSFQNLLKKGDLYSSEKNYTKAREYYNKALDLLSGFEADEHLLQVYYKLARLDYEDESYKSSIAIFKQALKIANKLEDYRFKADIYTQISYVLYDNFDYNNSAQYLLAAANIYQKIESFDKYAEAVFNLAIIYRKLSSDNEAKHYNLEYKKYKKYIKGRFYMFSEDVDNRPYYVDLTDSPNSSSLYETSFVLVRILNKVTARTDDFRVLVGSKLEFQTIELIPHSCFRSRPDSLPENKLLLSVNELSEEGGVKEIYHGWLFSSSPSIATLEHPFYDVILLGCIGKE